VTPSASAGEIGAGNLERKGPRPVCRAERATRKDGLRLTFGEDRKKLKTKPRDSNAALGGGRKEVRVEAPLDQTRYEASNKKQSSFKGIKAVPPGPSTR